MSNLSNGTTVYGKATRSGYEDKTVSGTINGSDLVLRITGDWIEESVEPDTYIFQIKYTPTNATCIINGQERSTYSAAEGETIEWSVSAPNYKTQSDSLTMPAEYTLITVDLVHEEVEPTYYTLTINGNGANSITVNGNTYSEPMQIEGGTTVKINAAKTDHHVKEWQDVSEDTTTLSPANNNFTMIKNTSINIIWEEDSIPVEECSVTVTVNGNLNFILGESEKKINYTIDHSGACDADDLNVSFESEDETIATVNDNGFVNAVGVGKTNVIVSAGDDSDKCHITIVAPTKFSAIPTKSGGQCDVNADTVEISLDQRTWTSETISDLNDGTTVYVRASKEGYADPSINTLTIDGADLYAYPSCDWKACVTNISFAGNTDPSVLRKGTTWNCPTPTITPEGAGARNIKFTSSDSSKVSVDEYNNLYANAVTSSPVTITITADTDCGEYTDSFTVSVVEDMVKVLCSPTNATVNIYSDSNRTNLIATCSNEDTFACDENATYYYTATANEYETATGEYTVEPTRTLHVNLTLEDWQTLYVENQTSSEEYEITWTGSKYEADWNNPKVSPGNDISLRLKGDGILSIGDTDSVGCTGHGASVGNVERSFENACSVSFDRNELTRGYYTVRIYDEQ